MARLSGSPSGATLTPPAFEPPAVAPRRAPRPRSKALPPKVDEAPPTQCASCLGAISEPMTKLTPKKHGRRYEPHCQHCMLMFGSSFQPGATNVSPEEAFQRLKSVQEKGFVMMLRELSVATRDGKALLIEPGDIFPVRFFSAPSPDVPGLASSERTQRLFTLPLQVGPHQVLLYPHEFDGISMERVMGMRRAGEISETFLSQDDDIGHFTPSPEMVQLIKDTFGSLVGVPSSPMRNMRVTMLQEDGGA